MLPICALGEKPVTSREQAGEAAIAYTWTMKLSIDLLIPTQRAIRNSRQIETMASFVRKGGVFDRDALDRYADELGLRSGPLVQIERFEDGLMYPRDGHHRLIGMLLGGREHLLSGEYQISERRYSEYEEINLEIGWVTPFDPRIEIRKEDLSDWKRQVLSLSDSASTDAVTAFIRANKSAYAEPRANVRHIRDIRLPVPYT